MTAKFSEGEISSIVALTPCLRGAAVFAASLSKHLLGDALINCGLPGLPLQPRKLIEPGPFNPSLPKRSRGFGLT
jgi:hypothetical protein